MISNQLLTASFRGIDFLVPDESKNGGKKTVSHEYPNSDRRYVEELGKSPASFNITAIIHGSDAIQRRIDFENALEQAGRGLLIHPSLGQQMVVATEYSSRSSDSEIGKFTFSITFKRSEENISLNAVGASNQFISSIVEDAKSNLDASFIDKFANGSFSDVIRENGSQLQSIITQARDVFGSVNNLQENGLEEFNRVLNSEENNILSIVRNGSDYASSLRSIYNSADNLVNDISQLYDSYITYTTFGNDRKSKALITQKRITEENNLSAVEEHTKINGLISAYEAAVYTDFQTDEELIAVQSQLNDSYDTLIENAPDTSIAYDTNTRDVINNLRINVREALENKRQNVWRIVDIDAGESSMPLTSYRFYGSLDNLNTVSSLNNKNNSIFSGVIKGIS